MKKNDEFEDKKLKGEFTIIVCGLLQDITFVIGILVFVGLMLI